MLSLVKIRILVAPYHGVNDRVGIVRLARPYPEAEGVDSFGWQVRYKDRSGTEAWYFKCESEVEVLRHLPGTE